jgi:sugar lactone lactonase YvrE
MSNTSRVTAIHPCWAVEGGRIAIHGCRFAVNQSTIPEVRIGEARARVVHASSTVLTAIVPSGVEGRATVRVEGVLGETAFVEVGAPMATGLHQVDNPVFDRDGNLYVTYSGTRGQQVPISIFRVRPNGTRETFSSGIVNATSLAIDPEGRLYVSSRFEGVVYRVVSEGTLEPFASGLGVACGLAFGSDGTLYVGDRSGTVFRVSRHGHATAFASLPPSVAAFHLAVGGDGAVYVTAPTLASRDPIYRIAMDGTVTSRDVGFGRPQGLAFDGAGVLHVVEALVGASGLYRVPADRPPELALAGQALVGLAFDPKGALVVCSNETAYRLNVNLRPLAM